MLRKIFTLLAIGGMALHANAIIWHCDNFNSEKMTCRISGWSGSQPSSGTLKVPSSYENANAKKYKVTAIASHALDDLTEVTEIVIPATVTAIGDQKSSSSYPLSSSVKNFDNCTKLVKFSVDADNPYFFSDSKGILYNGEKYNNVVSLTSVLKVPAKVKTSSGVLKLADGIIGIAQQAFKGNLSVKSLYIPDDVCIYENGGLNHAENLAEYHLIKTGRPIYPLQVIDNCLILNEKDTDSSWVAVSVPPASTRKTCSLPSYVTTVRTKAFMNTVNLETVDLNKVIDIEENAFNNSNVTSLTIPASVKELEEGALQKAYSLKTLAFKGKNVVLPDDFANNCKALTKVTAEYPLKSVGRRAFKNCSSLKTFPFSVKTDFDGDSIFYNTAFKEVVFPSEKITESCMGNDMFVSCDNLTLMDFSAVTDTKTTNFFMGHNMVKKCPKLTRLVLPQFTIFYDSSTSTTKHKPSFNTTNLQEIEMGTFFNNNNVVQFRYAPIDGVTEFKPNVYVAVTRNRKLSPNDYNSMPLYNLFDAVNGAKVSPNYYCDLYDPREDDWYDDHVADCGIYYVPGGCSENYGNAKENRRQVYEMYKFSVKKDGKNMIVKTWTGATEVTNLTLVINDEQSIKLTLKEEVTLPVSYSSVKSLLLKYKVNGVQLQTLYPKEFWTVSNSLGDGVGSSNEPGLGNEETTGVDEIENSSKLPYIIYNLSGVKVAEGEGEAETSGLPKGIYIIRQGSKSEKIRI